MLQENNLKLRIKFDTTREAFYDDIENGIIQNIIKTLGLENAIKQSVIDVIVDVVSSDSTNKNSTQEHTLVLNINFKTVDVARHIDVIKDWILCLLDRKMKIGFADNLFINKDFTIDII